MNARKCVHAQKPYPPQAVAHESSKVGKRGKREEEEVKERKRDGKDRGQEADGKKGIPTKQNTLEELKQGLTKKGVGAPNFSYPQKVTPCPHN